MSHRCDAVGANRQRDSGNGAEESVEVAGIGAAATQCGEEGKGRGAKQEREVHADAVGIQPIQCRPPHASDERHGAIHEIRLAKGQLARGFDLRARVIAFEKREKRARA